MSDVNLSNKLALTVDETAEVLGISRPKVYDLIHSDGFPHFQIGTCQRIPVDGLRAWVAKQAGEAV